MYGIQDLDSIAQPCSLKNEGTKRLVKVAGMIRLMGIDRFERLVIDLRYCRKTFASSVQRYAASAVNLPPYSPFRSFVKEPSLKGLAVADDSQILEMLMIGDYSLFDRTGLSLNDFIR